LRERASSEAIERSEVPLASTIAGYVLEAVGRFADGIEENTSFSSSGGDFAFGV